MIQDNKPPRLDDEAQAEMLAMFLCGEAVPDRMWQTNWDNNADVYMATAREFVQMMHNVGYEISPMVRQ